ncbi:MAG: hypothetical protein ACYDIE_04765 [Candidatus Krumholzibacteriia bacterium]
MQSSRRREITLLAGVLILMFVIGSANLRASRRDSAALVCLSNMRTLMRGADVYAASHAVAGPSLDIVQLERTGIVTEKVGRCPLGTGPGPDYLLTLRDGRPVRVVCLVDSTQHRWTAGP